MSRTAIWGGVAVEDPTIAGHPAFELESVIPDAPPLVVTVCAECGAMRSVLWLNKDRWFCNQCKAEGARPPNMFPIA